MSLFHKHTWVFVSANDKAGKEWNFILNQYVETYQETVVIDMCTDCKHFRTRILSGHHAKAIQGKYEKI